MDAFQCIFRSLYFHFFVQNAFIGGKTGIIWDLSMNVLVAIGYNGYQKNQVQGLFSSCIAVLCAQLQVYVQWRLVAARLLYDLGTGEEA